MRDKPAIAPLINAFARVDGGGDVDVVDDGDDAVDASDDDVTIDE